MLASAFNSNATLLRMNVARRIPRASMTVWVGQRQACIEKDARMLNVILM